MNNGRWVACGSDFDSRAVTVLLLVTALVAGCAAVPPEGSEDAGSVVDAVASSSAIAKTADLGLPAGEHAVASARPWQWHTAPSSVSQVPDGNDDPAVSAAPQQPPLFTPEQAAAETAAAADRAAESFAAESNGMAGGPSIRFKKPFGEPGVAGDGKEVDRGTASWYGLQFHGRRTANGERYDMYDLTAAHKTLPFNTIVSVHNLQSGRSVRVRINDRGPFVDGRVIDLSKAAAEQLGMAEVGLRPVSLVVEEWPADVDNERDAKRQTNLGKKKPRSVVPDEGP